MSRTAETVVQQWVQNQPDAPFGWWVSFVAVQVMVLVVIAVLIWAVTGRGE